MKQIRSKGQDLFQLTNGHTVFIGGTPLDEENIMKEEDIWEILVAYLGIKHKFTTAVFMEDAVIISTEEYERLQRASTKTYADKFTEEIDKEIFDKIAKQVVGIMKGESK